MITAVCAALAAAAAPLLEQAQPDLDATLAWTVQALPHVGTCQDAPAFLVALGRLHLRLGRAEEAADHLERALLIAPDSREARWAFGEALARLGDRQAAAALLHDKPASAGSTTNRHGATLHAQGATAAAESVSVATGADERSQWRRGGAVQSGHEANLLGAASARSITLTFPGLDSAQPVLITLPVDENFRPNRGAYHQVAGYAQWLWQRAQPQAGREPAVELLNAQASVRLRHVPQLQEAGYHVADAAIEHSRFYSVPRVAGVWQPGHYAGLSLAALNSQTGVRFSQATVAGGAAWVTAACGLRLGLEWQDRRYASNPVLDGRQTAASAQARCGAWPAMTFRLGQDEPIDSTRPGGAQRVAEARLQGRWGAWGIEAEWTHLRDQAAYSPLIESGARRRQHRAGVRLEYAQPLHRLVGRAVCEACTGWHGYAGLDVQRQESNLNLFRTNNLGVFIGVKIAK